MPLSATQPPQPEAVTSARQAFAQYGLTQRGGAICATASDPTPSGMVIVLLGGVGVDFWPHFQQALPGLLAKGSQDPLDDWTKGLLAPIAATLGALLILPNDGPPYYPFQQWARAAEPVHPSPLGILLHPQYGLWHSYRAALAWDASRYSLAQAKQDFPQTSPQAPQTSQAITQDICASCPDKPCISACPAQSFCYPAPAAGPDLSPCISFQPDQQIHPCLASGSGCKSRHACPVGQELHYTADQDLFHLSHFLARHRPQQAK